MTISPTDSDIERIALEIERYLSQHSDARDTAQGIARWWLAAAHIKTDIPRVEAALESLIQRGVVQRRKLAGGSVVYSAR